MKLGNKEILIGSVILILLLSLILFKTDGILTTFAIFVIFILPFYIILNNFNLKIEEEVLFSLLIGFTIIPSLVYYISIILNSIKIAIIIVVLLLIAVGIILTRIMSSKNKKN